MSKNTDCYDNLENEFDEQTSEDAYIEAKWSNLQQFTMDEFLECKHTKNLLEQEWDHAFETTTQGDIEEIFTSFAKDMDYSGSNVLALADERHSEDLLELVRYHIDKQYSLQIFADNPDLAEPICYKRDEAFEQRLLLKKETQKKETQKKSNKKGNKQFNWLTKKYT